MGLCELGPPAATSSLGLPLWAVSSAPRRQYHLPHALAFAPPSLPRTSHSVLHILPPWHSMVSLPPALLLGPWLLLNPLSTLEPTVSSPHSQSAPYPGATSTPPTCS